MAQVIIFKRSDGGISVCIPNPEVVALVGIEAIARKDVPAGRPFKIVDEADLPDRSTQDFWLIDDVDLDDGVGATSSEFPPELRRLLP
ncbi:hypothetical protein UFOVP435_20 [uncultured Caudovirales phage]|uniref:Uncharacterized protein n=1 Tax=uncultured Caudovirales phage TaxID=2100421 RepID=A0A6J5MG95_9CAUD|nr:hypothetical protein UFOVP435_20 [uncultured Caudovirales phage]